MSDDTRLDDAPGYKVTLDLRETYDGKTPAQLALALMRSMTSQEPIEMAFMHEGKQVRARVRIVGVRETGPGLYEVSAEDADAGLAANE